MEDSAMLDQSPAAARSGGNGNGYVSPGSGSSQPGPALFVRLARLSDTVIALATLITAFLVTNVGRMPHGLQDFLALRLTVKNLLLLVGFAVAWRGICTVSGLYRWNLVQRRRNEAIRVLVAATLGGA